MVSLARGARRGWCSVRAGARWATVGGFTRGVEGNAGGVIVLMIQARELKLAQENVSRMTRDIQALSEESAAVRSEHRRLEEDLKRRVMEEEAGGGGIGEGDARRSLSNVRGAILVIPDPFRVVSEVPVGAHATSSNSQGGVGWSVAADAGDGERWLTLA